MNALGDRIVAALQEAGGSMATAAQLRSRVGCSADELKAAIQSLRWSGKMAFGKRIALSPSMMAEIPARPTEAEITPAASTAAPCEGAVRNAETAAPSPSPAAQLLAEVADYCRRTGTHEGFIGKVAFNHPGFVPLLRKRGTLREPAAAEIRAVMARFPAGISKAEAVAPCDRREPFPRSSDVAPASFKKREDGVLERVSGEGLLAEIDAFIARFPGLTRGKFCAALGKPTLSLQLERAAYPKLPTIEAVRSFIASEPDLSAFAEARPPITRDQQKGLGLPPSGREIRDDRAIQIQLERRERENAALDAAALARECRRPGESLADAAARQREERYRNATRLTTRHPLPPASSLSLTEEDEEDLGEISRARLARETHDVSSPSAVLRRAQRDWPEQCAKVKALADELGVTIAEAWRRVIAAGVDCLTDPEAV